MVQYIGALEGCRLRICCFKLYGSVCHAKGFGLLLAKVCYRTAALTPGKQKYSLRLSAYVNRTAVYACSGM